MTPHSRAWLQIHTCVLLWGVTAILGKLITLDKKVKAHGGKLKLSNIRPEIYEVFVMTHLNKLFDIKDDEADALATF